MPILSPSRKRIRPNRIEALPVDNPVILPALGQRADPVADFALSAAEGLTRKPPRLECRFLYDARGSALYEAITRQPEYYPTRTEAAILARHAGDIRKITGAVTLLELGAGNGEKTDCLLSAWLDGNRHVCYLPVDISETALLGAGRDIVRRRPGVRVIGIHGTYEDAFPLLRSVSPVMVLFLGSTIGNMDQDETSSFLDQMATNLRPGDYFLLGLDLVKETSLLNAAYNDAAGVSAAFTRNLFVRMNRELGSGIDVEAVEHQARYDATAERIEIDARFRKPQTIRIAPLDRSFTFAGGESIRTEISRKFRLETMVPELESSGFDLLEAFTDERRWFALLLLKKRRD